MHSLLNMNESLPIASFATHIFPDVLVDNAYYEPESPSQVTFDFFISSTGRKFRLDYAVVTDNGLLKVLIPNERVDYLHSTSHVYMSEDSLFSEKDGGGLGPT
uniref:Uncharacterized protein n=1 Tax=Moniliophthora roreri TaxID=221103 RepID=A0A0W0GA15_MONRR